MWAVKVGAGLSGGVTHVLASSPLKAPPSLVFNFWWRGLSSQGQGRDVWKLVGEKGEQGSKLPTSGQTWAEPGLFWASPCIGRGSCLLCRGLGFCQEKGGPAPWGVERNENQI